MNAIEKKAGEILLTRVTDPTVSARDALSLMLAYQSLVAAATERVASENNDALGEIFPDTRWQ